MQRTQNTFFDIGKKKSKTTKNTFCLEYIEKTTRIFGLKINFFTHFRSGINNNENQQNQTVDNPNLTPSKYSEVEHGAAGETFDKNMLKSFTKNKAFKTRHKLKAHTSKIVSSFKPPAMTCMLAKEFGFSTEVDESACFDRGKRPRF